MIDVFSLCCFFFFFNDTATTEIYTLSLHDALPISRPPAPGPPRGCRTRSPARARPTTRSIPRPPRRDRKSTRLNSSHGYISYAVFCLKKKKNNKKQQYIARVYPAYTSQMTCSKQRV